METKEKKDFFSFTLAEKKAHYERLKRKYPNHVFVILRPQDHAVAEAFPRCPEKYVLGNDATGSDLLIKVRGYLKLNQEQGIFLFVHPPPNRFGISHPELLVMTTLMSQIHRTHAHADGFLYFTYNKEDVFG
jgi:hypothetical protein